MRCMQDPHRRCALVPWGLLLGRQPRSFPSCCSSPPKCCGGHPRQRFVPRHHAPSGSGWRPLLRCHPGPPLTRTGQPQPCAAVGLRSAADGRELSMRLLLVRVRASRAPPAWAEGRCRGARLDQTNYRCRHTSPWKKLLCLPRPQQDDDPGIDVTRGWQRSATRALDDSGDRALRRELDSASAAMLDSQSGPRVLTARPTSPELCLPSPLFRALLFRRLRMPLPLAPAACRCRRGLDALGDHVAACPRCGVLRSRGGSFENAAARVLLRSWSHSPAARPASGLEC